MKKHFRYLKIFTAVVVLLGLTVAARPGDTEAPEPNTPTPAESQEPNAPAENRQLTTPEGSLEPNSLAESWQLKAPAESQEPNAPAESQDLTTLVDSQEPNAPTENQQLDDQVESSEPTSLGGVQEPDRPTFDQKQSDSANSWYTYRIVTERNIFSRQRGPRINRRRTQRQVPVAPPAPDPESYVVLKGIVQEGGEFIAFLEDTQSGQILRVRKGDSVVRGKIKSLTLDSIEYEFEDKTTIVTMDLNLQGGRDGTTFTGMYELSQISSTTTEAGTTESSAPPSEDEAEILRQLMERRQQQVGQ